MLPEWVKHGANGSAQRVVHPLHGPTRETMRVEATGPSWVGSLNALRACESGSTVSRDRGLDALEWYCWR